MAGTDIPFEQGTHPSRLPDTTEEEGDTATKEVRNGKLPQSLPLPFRPRFEILPLPVLLSLSNSAPLHLLILFSIIKDRGYLNELTRVTTSSMRLATD